MSSSNTARLLFNSLSLPIVHIREWKFQVSADNFLRLIIVVAPDHHLRLLRRLLSCDYCESRRTCLRSRRIMCVIGGISFNGVSFFGDILAVLSLPLYGSRLWRRPVFDADMAEETDGLCSASNACRNLVLVDESRVHARIFWQCARLAWLSLNLKTSESRAIRDCSHGDSTYFYRQWNRE